MVLQPGATLGSYEILALLGRGRMGEVWRARNRTLNRDVALKVLPPDVTPDRERLARFDREAQLLASMSHPNIGAIYGLHHGDSVIALVLELVDGPTLTELIGRGPVPLDAAIRIARDVAAALEAAHERGIIHRDLKPANVKLTMDDHVKVLDFGLAKALDISAVRAGVSVLDTSPALGTASGVILGTPLYMSPEQAKGQAVDRPSDVWAFGCVLYELLTGARPFAGDSAAEVVTAIPSKEADLLLGTSLAGICDRRHASDNHGHHQRGHGLLSPPASFATRWARCALHRRG
jgi:eukaryotic-like serine/threonine-protein kinase